MEAWVPLFDIFLNSPCPEGEASLWMQNSFEPSKSNGTTTNSFLSLLSKPTPVMIGSSSTDTDASVSPSQSKAVMWIQTLPNAMQSRILSFLSVEWGRFCARDLCVLANNVLKGSEELDFWVKKAARNLLDVMPNSSFDGIRGLNLGSSDGRVEEEFEALPSWLHSGSGLLFPWLPISHSEFGKSTLVSGCSGEERDELMLAEVEEECQVEALSQAQPETETVSAENVPIGPEIQRVAASLKTQILTFESTAKTVDLANEILQLCFNELGGGNSLSILGLIEPWEADDETASILISHLLADGRDVAWPSHVLCSVILPKLLVLVEPASRMLVTAIIGFCKLHQKAAVDALLLPLVLHKEGINTSICDVVTRIIRECLHPAHVSSFCHRLLCEEPGTRGIVCLPCHQCQISSELVWTEPLFTLFQNILNFNVYLTQDSVDHLISAVQQSVGSYSKSLKFGNFLLCFVTKCDQLLKHHKILLTELVGQTNTFVTKSILSKLGRL